MGVVPLSRPSYRDRCNPAVIPRGGEVGRGGGG